MGSCARAEGGAKWRPAGPTQRGRDWTLLASARLTVITMYSPRVHPPLQREDVRERRTIIRVDGPYPATISFHHLCVYPVHPCVLPFPMVLGATSLGTMQLDLLDPQKRELLEARLMGRGTFTSCDSNLSNASVGSLEEVRGRGLVRYREGVCTTGVTRGLMAR